MLSHGVKLLVLEEPLTRAALLELPEHRRAEQLVVLVSDPEHAIQHRELAVDRAVGCALAVSRLGVCRRVSLADPGNPASGEEAVKVRKAMLRLLEVPRPRRHVVAPQVGRRLLVPDPVGAWEHGQASRDAPLALFHEPLGLRALLGTRALAHRAAVHVILHPPDVSRCAIPRLLFVQGPHQLLLSPAARAGSVLGETGSSGLVELRVEMRGCPADRPIFVVRGAQANDALDALLGQDFPQAFQTSMRRSSSSLSKSSFRSSAPPGRGTVTRFRTPLASRSRIVQGETPR